MKIDKDAVGAVFAMVGLALCALAGMMTVFFTKWREHAPLVRQQLIDWSYKASDFASWLDSPQFWIGVCFTLLCTIVVVVFVFLNKDKF